MTSSNTPPGGMRWARLGMLLCGYAIILAIGHWGGTWLSGRILPEPGLPLSGEILTMLALSFALYVVLLALPFVPGMEVSLAILAALGGRAAIPIYLATIAALVIAFAAGRLMPMRTLVSVFDYLGLGSARDHVLRLEPMTRQARIETLTSAVPSRPVSCRFSSRIAIWRLPWLSTRRAMP